MLRKLVLRVVGRAQGHALLHLLHEHIHAFARFRGYWNHLLEGSDSRVLFHQWKRFLRKDEVHLVEDQKRRFRAAANPVQRPPGIVREGGFSGIHHEKQDVRIGYGAVHVVHHLLVEEIPGADDPRRVQKHDLAHFIRMDAQDAVSRRTRPLCNDRQLPAKDVVHQRRLAHVRRANDGHVAASVAGWQRMRIEVRFHAAWYAYRLVPGACSQSRNSKYQTPGTNFGRPH